MLPLAACDDAAPARTGPSAAAVTSPAGSPLRVVTEAEPGPEGADPPCASFAPGARCTVVGAVRWVLTVDDGRWTLTEYDVDEELQQWVPGLRGTGIGAPPRVVGVDLGPEEQPESVVLYGGAFDVVATGEAGIPAVVLSARGTPQVDRTSARVGGREVRLRDGRWELVPVA